MSKMLKPLLDFVILTIGLALIAIVAGFHEQLREGGFWLGLTISASIWFGIWVEKWRRV